MDKNSGFWQEKDVISRYTRAQAIEDGVIVDVSKLANEAGFPLPTAITAGVSALINDIPEKEKGCEDVTGRLWDVLTMGIRAMRFHRNESEYTYQFMITTKHCSRLHLETLKVSLVSGDTGETVINISLPNED
jgi:hypothetical protein